MIKSDLVVYRGVKMDSPVKVFFGVTSDQALAKVQEVYPVATKGILGGDTYFFNKEGLVIGDWRVYPHEDDFGLLCYIELQKD